MTQAAQASTETGPLSSVGSIAEAIAASAAPAAAASPATAASAVAPAKPAPRATPGFMDPLDESEFEDSKLATPEAIRAAAAKVRAEVKAALDLRRAAHNARAEAERKEAKLGKTKAEVLADKAAHRANAQRFEADVLDIRSGDPQRFIQAIGRLSGEPDAIEFWKKAAIAVAKGKPVDTNEIPDAVKKQLDELKATLATRDEAEQAKQTEAQILELRRAQVQYASESQEHPMLAGIAKTNPAGIDEALMAIRIEHHKQTGTPLDVKSACDRLEADLKSQLELLQRASNPNGALDGEREAAAPVAGQAGKPEQIAKPEQAQSPPNRTQTVTAIPSSLTSEPAANKRKLSAAEQKEAITAELDKMGFFQSLLG